MKSETNDARNRYAARMELSKAAKRLVEMAKLRNEVYEVPADQVQALRVAFERIERLEKHARGWWYSGISTGEAK